MISARIGVLFLASILLSCATPEPGPQSLASIEFRISSVADMFYAVRAEATNPSTPADPTSASVAAALPIARRLGDFGGWGLVEGAPHATLADMRINFEGRRDPELRAEALALADALIADESRYLATDWPARRVELERIESTLQRDFIPRHRRALAFMSEWLGIHDPGGVIPVYLVLDMSEPGAWTFRGSDGAPVLVMDANADRGSAMYETILHEGAHALDTLANGRDDVFDTLRTLLRERGVETSNPLYRDAPHAIMFVHGAEATRRFYNPRHVDYGDTSGLYARQEAAFSIIGPAWRRYLAGEVDRQETLVHIADALTDAP